MDFKETAFEYISCQDHANFCTSETKWIRKITELAKSHPEEVQITVLPEKNSGMLCAHLPKSWFRISPPKKMNFTDEQRTAAAERLSKARQKKAGE